ncbi:MAG: flagellar hook-associated protein FlgK [Gemmatales bacterium]|nr:flagellar hook-associated protein FlgK [Gemmatales bacterium]MDW7994320.1 flagellar hook-associated protein FlgK [Gemmatales bacterium]
MAIVNFATGLSALQVNQRVLELLGHNIANINTPGYHRREPLLAARFVPDDPIGFGVEIAEIRRLRDAILEQTIWQHSSELADLQSRLMRLEEIESFFGTGTHSLRGLLDEFFNRLERLSVRPTDLTSRSLVVEAAQRLAQRFREVNDQLLNWQHQLTEEIRTTVARINALATQIAELNAAISRGIAQGATPHDALDRRDQLLSQLAELVAIQVVEQPLEQVNVLAGGAMLVMGDTSHRWHVDVDSQNQVRVTLQGSGVPIEVTAGSLAGLLAVRNGVLPELTTRLNRLAKEVMRCLDNVHVAGLGLSGEFRFLAGVRSVSNVNLALEHAEPAFTIRRGAVWVSVTNTSTGERTIHAVNIDPQTQTLAQLAVAFSSVPHIQAIADPQTRTLQFLAEPGYVFDFAGRLPTQLSGTITGTARPRVSGSYTGSQNDVYTIQAVNSGTVGVTPHLTLEIRNSAGQLLGTVSVGQGYAPGSAVSLVDGLILEMSPGTLQAGDAFQVPVIAQPDTSGLLTALGLNTLFAGSDAGTMRVHPEVAASPERLALSRSGATADTERLQQMLALREQPVFDSGLTLGGYYDRLIADLATQLQAMRQNREHLQVVGQQLQVHQQAISGVDANEEVVRLLQYQRAFQLAARYIVIVHETFEELLRLV